MSSRDFALKVGEMVTAMSGGIGLSADRPIAVSTIKSINSRYYILADGSEWNAKNDWRWGDQNGWGIRPHVIGYKEEHADYLRTRQLLKQLQVVVDAGLGTLLPYGDVAELWPLLKALPKQQIDEAVKYIKIRRDIVVAEEQARANNHRR